MKQKKSFKVLKRVIAFVTAYAVIMGMFPGYTSRVKAFDESLYRVDSVTVFKVYDENGYLKLRRVMITGRYLKDAEVGIITSKGYQGLTKRTVNTDGLLQYDITQDQLGSAIMINGVPIPINEGDMPTLTGVNRRVQIGIDNLVLEGTNLKNVLNDTASVEIKVGYEHEGAYTQIDEAAFGAAGATDSLVTVPTPSGALGLQNIIFEKRETLYDVTFNDANKDRTVEVTVKYTYEDQFRFVRNIDIDGLEMRPNRGEKGDKVFFEANTPKLNNYDVFFLKKIDGTDAYTIANKGKNKTFQQNVDGKDILTVEVPDLPIGEYYVVLTNPISEGVDPMKEVVQEKIVGNAPDYEKFTIIDSTVKSKIINVQPDSGPDSGSKTTISGQFFVTLNIPEYVQTSPSITIEDPATDTNPQQLLVTYGAGKYNGIDIVSAQRRITVIIGGNATFVQKNDGTYDVTYNKDLDKITVMTSQVTDAETDPKKDVVVETETVFTKLDGSTIVIKERAELIDGYTYIPSKLTPEITDATPNKIQVTRISDTEYVIPEDRIVAIHGKNFMIHKYTSSAGEVIRYPIIEFGPSIGINKNTKQNDGDPAPNPDVILRIFDSSGKELDGTEGNELGTKILVTIPKGKVVSALGKTYLRVSNPVRNSDNTGLSAQKNDYIEFVCPDVNKNPVITSVAPSVSTVDGGELITIEGSNFADGVKVFLDGEEITGIKRQGDGKKITFTCPKGREGETQLQVMNPEGGMATWPFVFVKTYTDPKIKDFSPKSGNTGTLVVITGENFLKPEPTATEDSIYKLIGTRVTLEGIEVNDYNVNSTTKKIELKDYISPKGEPILKIENSGERNKQLKIASYYSGVILKDIASGRFYTLDVDVKGRITLSDGAGNNYTIGIEENHIVASKEGGSVESLVIDDPNDGVDTASTITLPDSNIVLKLQTLYKTEKEISQDINGDGFIGDDIIVGNRVKVIDRNLIYFTVPILEADGYYDLTVINPDTKKDSKIDSNGFYYYGKPQSKPTLTSIFPDEGSTAGGYTIVINGSEFEDNGISKSKVFINGIEIIDKNIVISPDGSSMTVVVPAYPGDLMKDRGTSRLTVPVVIVNPDGGSASKEDGFTYVVPGSHPQISRIVPQKGAASGGDVVEIIGTDFRYFEPYDDANRNQIRDPDEEFNNLNGNYDENGPIWDSEDDLLNNVNNVREPRELSGNARYTEYYASPILPRVYFGDKQAKIVEFSRGYIKVITPENTAGTVDVFLINNDSGTSNKLRFTYDASNPKINKILPAEGKKQGKDKVEIIGSNFEQSTIDEYLGTVDENGNNDVKQYHTALVRFGNITNRDIAREQENSGRIDNSRATVNLAGGLSVEYDGTADTLNVILNYNGLYSAKIKGYKDDVKFIPLSILKDSNGVYCDAYELIKVEVSDRRLIVERGYSPSVEFINAGQLAVYTPSYYTVGSVTVSVINPDGGIASGKFEYKNPSSNPKIITITKEGESPVQEDINGKSVMLLRMNYKGGNIVSIIGEDFRDNAVVQISDVAELDKSKITYSLPNKLTFEMPSVPESAVGKLHRVVVLNEDGGSAASDELIPPIYILFTKGETNPEITALTPDKGSSNGGSRVKIEGKDFRERMEEFGNRRLSVYFGEVKVPDSNVSVVDHKTIYVTVPSSAPGKVEVRIENPDGVVTKPGAPYTYISAPKVIAVVDAADATETARIKTISVEGGQEIKLKGSGFMDGAKVIFMPQLEKADNESATGSQIIYIEGQAYILKDGVQGTNVKFIDAETLTVTTPKGKMDATGVIVINPDGGASDIYNDLIYGLPEISAPTGVHAELVFDRYIKITWSGVSGAREYEIYVVIDDEEVELVGSTELNSFLYTDIEPKTKYKFIVKAVGDFGPSNPSQESNTVKTGSKAGYPDEDGELNEKTKIERNGEIATVAIGEDDFDDKAITIDLTRGNLAGCKEVIISMPASVVTSSRANDITVIGKDFRIKFNPVAFNNSTVENNKRRDDAGVRFRIAPYNGGTDSKYLGIEGIPLSGKYILEASIYVGKDSTKMSYIKSTIEITMDFDVSKAQMRRYTFAGLNRYEDYENGWIELGYTDSDMAAVTALTEKLGIFTVFGRRR